MPGCTSRLLPEGPFSREQIGGGYAHSVSGSSAEGYNGQATLNVTF
nr:hypothetical protein [Escherichia coli]